MRGTFRARGRGRSVSSRPAIPKAKARTAREEFCENDYEGEEEEEVPLELEGEEEPGPRSAVAPTTLPDEEITRREEHYQTLRRSIGVGTESDKSENAPLGFHADTLEAIQAQWDPLSAGELLARVGHFLRIVSHMMEEIGYMTEVISRRGHRPQSEETPPTSCRVQSDLYLLGIAGGFLRPGRVNRPRANGHVPKRPRAVMRPRAACHAAACRWVLGIEKFGIAH